MELAAIFTSYVAERFPKAKLRIDKLPEHFANASPPSYSPDFRT